MNSNRTSHFILSYHKYIFYGAWLLLNLVQAAATGLLHDETYYWAYAQFLDWGYFDHPPMVALLIKAGYAIFPNEFGLRLLFAVMSTITLGLIEKLLPVKDDLLFYTIALSMAVLQIGGIIAIPDTPLLFFTALYFLVYKKFLERPGASMAILLGICMALLLYSKYHGVLLIIFTLLSNPKLFTRLPVYIAGVTALVLFSPHLYWQYVHGFPSIQFHLLERNAREYKFTYTLEYIIGQIPLPALLASPILFWGAFRKKPADWFERSLQFTLIGTYLFFLLFTLKGRVEANWTIPAFVPLIVLSHQYLLDKYKLRKWLTRLTVVTMVIVFAMRINLIVDLFPDSFKKSEYQYNKEWADAIEKKANGLPVFFTDSYQRPAKYWFYTGHPSFSLNTVDYRRNNFNFWPLEEQFMNKRAYAVYQGRKADYYIDSIATPKGVYLGRTIENYFSFSRIRIIPSNKLVANNGTLNVSLKVLTDESILPYIKAPYDTLHIWLSVYRDSIIQNIPTNLTLGMIKKEKEVLSASFAVPLPAGKYWSRFGITSCIDNWPTINSTAVRMSVK
ncbi:MAG: glycosyltransferase family 39 protein [Chitinophagaceae bacterium]